MIINNIVFDFSKIKEHLINKKTPAVTIVAACNKEDTGVGPSIASGNHVCKPIWADLPIAPKNNKNKIKSIIFISVKNINIVEF
jgi:recombinational DNA repair protein (RecF pathway)